MNFLEAKFIKSSNRSPQFEAENILRPLSLSLSLSLSRNLNQKFVWRDFYLLLQQKYMNHVTSKLLMTLTWLGQLGIENQWSLFKYDSEAVFNSTCIWLNVQYHMVLIIHRYSLTPAFVQHPLTNSSRPYLTLKCILNYIKRLWDFIIHNIQKSSIINMHIWPSKFPRQHGY